MKFTLIAVPSRVYQLLKQSLSERGDPTKIGIDPEVSFGRTETIDLFGDGSILLQEVPDK